MHEPTDSAPVTVVIVNWNGHRHLLRCLQALQQQSFSDFRVLVMDNGSTDGSEQLVAALADPRFTLALLLILLGVLVGLALVAQDHWKQGLSLMGVTLLAGALIRQFFVMRHGYKLGRNGHPWPYALVGVLVLGALVILALIAITYIPALTLWLPHQMGLLK